MKKIIFFLFLILLVIFAACSPTKNLNSVNNNVTGTEVFSSETATLAMIETTLVIPTDTPTVKPSLTLTNTPTSTVTLVPTEVVKFDSARIIGIDDNGSYVSVIFEFIDINQVYRVTINGSEYLCVIVEDVLDRLFCSGNKLRVNEYAVVKFFNMDDSDDELFAAELYVPEPLKTPLPAGDPSTWCPLRGTNISCETEHRVENGEECWVQTCVDACGYYYSYHTCQLPPNNNFLPP